MRNVNSDIAYAYIRKRIVDGTFTPGQQLMTRELSAEIGVSRTPVRDALRQLEADGLVIIRPRLGASVKTLDFREYREMCILRLGLESFAAGLAAENRTVGELREMEHALEAMRRHTDRLVTAEVEDQMTLDELRREDVQFHVAIISAAKCDLLKKEVLRLHLISRVASGTVKSMTTEKAIKETRRRAAQVSHDEIYQAIERGDAAVAKSAMERHIQDIIDSNIRGMARSDHGSTTRVLSEEELSYTG